MFVTQLQMRALASAQVDRFARDMEVHCGRVFPRTHASLQGPELTAAVRSAIDRAISHGFNQQGSVRLYIELSFIFGHRFDIDPLTPWVAPILDRYAKDDPLSAAEALYSVSLKWIEQTHGPGNSHLLAALHTLRAVTQQRIGGSEGWRSDTLARVYPQKVEALGAAGMQRFLVEAQARIDPLGLASDEAGSVACLMMFFMGSDCFTDPVFPWLQRLLSTPPGAARDARMREASLIFLRRVVQPADSDA